MDRYSVSKSELPEKYSAFYKKLEGVPNGIYPCKKRRFFDFKTVGWISLLRKENGAIELMWTSHKNSHSPLHSDFPVYAGDFFEDKIEWLMRSIISMHPIHDVLDRNSAVSFLMERMESAIKKMGGRG